MNMKKDNQTDTLRPEYKLSELRNRTRGKYAQRYAQGTNVVLLEPDVAEAFPDSDSVNSALRKLIEVTNKQVTP